MKSIIDGKLYDTETAEKVCCVDNGLGQSDFRGYCYTLYKTKNGRFFAEGTGGPMTMFAQPAGNMTSGGSGIVVMEEEEARRAAESCHSDASTDTIQKYFKIEEA